MSVAFVIIPIFAGVIFLVVIVMMFLAICKSAQRRNQQQAARVNALQHGNEAPDIIRRRRTRRTSSGSSRSRSHESFSLRGSNPYKSGKPVDYQVPVPAANPYGAAGPVQYNSNFAQPPNSGQFNAGSPFPVMRDVDLSNRNRWISLRGVRAVGLRSADRNGTSDPFFRIYDGNRKIFQSKHISKSLNPEWDEEAIRVASHGLGHFTIAVYDHNALLPARFLGEAKIEKADVAVGEAEEMWMPLNPKLNANESDAAKVRGEICVAIGSELMAPQESVDQVLSDIRRGRHNNVFINLVPGRGREALSAVAVATTMQHFPIQAQSDFSLTTHKRHTYRRSSGSGNHRRTYYVTADWYGTFMIYSDGAGDIFARMSYDNPEGNSDFRNDFILWASAVLQGLLDANLVVLDPRLLSVTSTPDGFASAPGCNVL